MAKILVRFGEIGLKGKNRKYFENALTSNIKKALRDLPGSRVQQVHGRNFVEVDEALLDEATNRLRRVFGIVSLSPVAEAALDLNSICAVALREFGRVARPSMSFKVQTKRANKRFPLLSPAVSGEVGAFLLDNLSGLTVDMHEPDITVEVEIRDHEAYVFTEKIAGPGGLPVGTTGKGLLLLSGGIDSPVAGYMAMKRGVKIEALHFHSPPFTSERSLEKVLDLCRVLALHNGPTRLHVAHFTDIQKELHQKGPEKLLVTLMRRMMFRIAHRLAKEQGALALFTGESLGQVASQTMESINVIGRVTDLPVFRPLIGFDKTEIVDISRRIDTYSISIRPHEDCCTVFLPAFPATRPRLADVEAAEKALDIDIEGVSFEVFNI